MKFLPCFFLTLNKSILLHDEVPKTAESAANTVDSDLMLHNLAFDLGLHYLLMTAYPDTKSIYSKEHHGKETKIIWHFYLHMYMY